MEIEIQKQIAESERQHASRVDELFLYQLHVQLGFGKKRLERFYRTFAPSHQALLTRYEMEDEGPWLVHHKLQELGVNIEEWEKGNFE